VYLQILDEKLHVLLEEKSRLFLQRGKSGERMLPFFLRFRPFKFGARLARIRVDAKDQELGRHRPEIDNTIFERLRRVALSPRCPRLGFSLRRRENKIDSFLNVAFDWFQRHHAGLTDLGPDLSPHRHAVTAPSQIE
jgi:hypothetical protein